MRTWRRNGLLAAPGLALALGATPRAARAHGDTLEGPVVQAAQMALERGDVSPTLSWVLPQHESEVRAVFERTLAVRRLGPEARELADRHFFETLVRLHRRGEGFGFEGLKPAGAPVTGSTRR